MLRIKSKAESSKLNDASCYLSTLVMQNPLKSTSVCWFGLVQNIWRTSLQFICFNDYIHKCVAACSALSECIVYWSLCRHISPTDDTCCQLTIMNRCLQEMITSTRITDGLNFTPNICYKCIWFCYKCIWFCMITHFVLTLFCLWSGDIHP